LATTPPNALVAPATSSIGVPGVARARAGRVASGVRSRPGGAVQPSLRCTAATSPSGATWNSTMMMTPKATVSKLPVVPISAGKVSCNTCFSEVIRPAPTMAPQMLAAPPITAMNRYSMPWLSENAAGLTKRWKWA